MSSPQPDPDEHRHNTEKELSVPDPTELELFLPWIIKQLQLDFDLVVKTTILEDYVSIVASDRNNKRGLKGKSRAKLPSSTDVDDADTNKTADTPTAEPTELFTDFLQNIHTINVVYENQHVVALKFEKNRTIPREIIKLITLVINFHRNLTSVSINRGLNAEVIYELQKLLCLSKITDLCLDNCFVEEGNYFILLEKQSCLKYLSLSRCGIDDTVVGLIAANLASPHAASTSLVVLNLSTNRISDVGMKSIGVSLRSNEKLAYLNVADNMISDEGLEYILSGLTEFPLTDEEVRTSTARRIAYLMSKKDAIENFIRELKTSDFDRKQQILKKKSKMASPTLGRKTKLADKESTVNLSDKGSYPFDSFLYERAAGMAEMLLGPFKDSFNDDNVFVRDGAVYCLGNHSLCYLNVAYNNLSYSSVRRLLDVLRYQRNVDRRPVGLVNMCLEGNPLPMNCDELLQIDALLDAGLSNLSRRSIAGQKKKSGKLR